MDRTRVTAYICPHCRAGYTRLIDAERHRMDCPMRAQGAPVVRQRRLKMGGVK